MASSSSEGFLPAAGTASLHPVVLRMSTAAPQGKKETNEEESNFWFAVQKTESVDDGKVPFYDNLDNDGPLPDACYNQLGDPFHEPKPNCLVGIDLKEIAEDDDEALSYLHQCIDAGLTTFHGGTSQTYRELADDTPRTVLNRCNWVTPIVVPEKLSNWRDVLLRPLQEMGAVADAIDTLQLTWNPNSLYFLDLLDVATDLQREGLIRSIVGSRLDPKMLREAHASGLTTIESNQIPVHLLDPCSHYTTEMLLAASDTDTALVADTPLVGGLLSNRYYEQPTEPYKFELTRSERRHLIVLYKWSKRLQHERDHSWEGFQSDMMEVMHHVSLKHRVSFETVALRWALELDQVSSVIVGEQQPISKLRQVFSLELDEEDQHLLWTATGCEKPLKLAPEIDFENLEEGDNGLFLPGDGKIYL